MKMNGTLEIGMREQTDLVEQEIKRTRHVAHREDSEIFHMQSTKIESSRNIFCFRQNQNVLGLLLMKRARISDLGLHQQTSLVQLWRIDHTTRPSVCCRATTKFENIRRLILGFVDADFASKY